MKQKIREILLIDDNEADNFLHQIVIEDLDCAEKVTALTNGKEAIDYIQKLLDEGKSWPEIVFLDINMPVMDGWEFLEEYGKLKGIDEHPKIIMMLTTSLNPDHKSMAESNGFVSSFLNKPLDEESLKKIIADISLQ
jgi:CheY-like chemotaxis protein